MKNLITLLVLLTISYGHCQKLIIIEQDFEKAQKLAEKENKLLFIDFYTTWCAPCKKLDKWIFQNDSISPKIGKDFILLRYDAENDKAFHLSKKHHVNSYPTGIVLNSNGYVVNRKYGFAGEEVNALSESVLEFTEKSIFFNQQNKILSGYSNNIDATKYPKFYVDFVNRDDKKVISRQDFKEYWNKQHDILSEEYFSTLVYFAKDIPIAIANNFLENKSNYTECYGKTDVDVALMFMSFGKFKAAIKNKNQREFDKASKFMKKALSEESSSQMLPLFKKKFEDSTKE